MLFPVELWKYIDFYSNSKPLVDRSASLVWASPPYFYFSGTSL